MKTFLYTVYDQIAMESSAVFHAKADQVAIRDYIMVMRKRDNPEDFKLLKMGTYDHDTCKAEMFDVPEEMHVAIAKKEEKDE